MKINGLLLAMSMLGVTAAFTSCSEETVPESAVDTKSWTLDDGQDHSYAPGDDFYNYCNAKWIAANPIPAGSYRVSRMDAGGDPDYIDNAVYKELKADMEHSDDYKEKDSLFKLPYLNKIDAIQKMDDVPAILAEYARLGFAPIISTADGKKSISCIFYAYPFQRKVKLLMDWMNGNQTSSFKAVVGDREKMMNFVADVKNRNRMSRSATNSAWLDKIASYLNFDTEYIFDADGYAKNMNDLQQLCSEVGLDRVKECLKMSFGNVVMGDFSDLLVDTDDQVDLFDVLYYLEDITFGYIREKTYIEKSGDDDAKKSCLDMCHNLHKTYQSRLAANTWMSETTRANAIEKLQNFLFYSCYPDTWVEDLATPVLVGDSPFQKMFNLRAKNAEYMFRQIGKDLNDENHWFFLSIVGFGPSLVNASYDPLNNTVTIFNGIVNSFTFDPNRSDAANYAMLGAIVGHEMTHGFDRDGSEYDKIGDSNFWWTYNDKMKFNELCQMLVSQYDAFYQWPGIHADGTLTLGENTADLGGLNIAYEAFVNKRISEGFNGEELNKEKRKFFESFGALWGNNTTKEYALQRLSNPHSMPQNRVNGVLMNMDDWYELYKVTKKNILYLDKSRRSYIW